MPVLTVKNLDERLHEALKREADREGRSLNSFVVATLERAANEGMRRERMRESAEDLEAFVASLAAGDNSAELLREDRESR